MTAENKDEILIAEDDEPISKLISYKLQKENLETSVVTEGDRVIPELKNGDYEALIMELMLPVLDGMSILNRIKEQDLEIPVLILSAKSQEKDIIKALNQGADEYITKPFRPDELMLRLKRLLGD
ncbi:response regulator transcription factor [Halanaerobium saccharolyticum]|uniref:response regulator transcription factor n=1 Tax=Halanaerobium saccharolyticum TaxID=43595 RepID=UPI003FCD4AAE